MRWFRLYDDVINDPKIMRLSESSRWRWIAVLCAASKNDGVIPPADDLAFVLRMVPEDVARMIADLTAADLIDYDGEKMLPHNWNGRQFKSDRDATAAKRKQEQRERQRVTRDGHGDVTRDGHGDVTRTEQNRTESDTESESKQKERKKRAQGALPPGWSESDWNHFWQIFPNKVGKPDARRAFEKATAKTDPPTMFAGLAAYVNKRDDRPWCNPATWLNQERWTDQPANVVAIKKRPFV